MWQCLTLSHRKNIRDPGLNWQYLWLAWLAWLLLGWIGSACGWPGCSWAATVQFCNEFPGSKYTLHLKVPKIAEFHALKLSTVKLSTAIWLHKWLITIKDHLTRRFLFCVTVPFAPCFELLKSFNLILDFLWSAYLECLLYWCFDLISWFMSTIGNSVAIFCGWIGHFFSVIFRSSYLTNSVF